MEFNLLTQQQEKEELFSLYRYEGTIVQSAIAGITIIFTTSVLIKYRKCKLDFIYYFLLGLFIMIMLLKILTSILELFKSEKSIFIAIFNGIVITVSYTSVLGGMQLFIYELDRMLYIMQSSNQQEFQKYLKTWRILRTFSISAIILQIAILTPNYVNEEIKFQRYDYFTDTQRNIMLGCGVTIKIINDITVFSIMIKCIRKLLSRFHETRQ